MKNIIVLSRSDFKRLLSELTEQQFAASAFISIHDPSGANSDVILEPHSNVLNLWFDDVDDVDDGSVDLLGDPIIPFDSNMASKLLEFIDVNKDKPNFVVHCTMGVSRSGAVGDFLSTYFGVPYDSFKRNNPKVIPNALVRKTLLNAM